MIGASHGGAGLLNEKALKIQRKKKISEMRDQAAMISSRLFIISSSESKLKMEIVNKSVFDACENALYNLPQMMVVKEGTVQVVGGKLSKKKRGLCLMSCKLVIKDNVSEKHGGTSYSLLSCMPHERLKEKNPLCIELVTPHDVLKLEMADEEEVEEWLFAILEQRMWVLSILADLCRPFRVLSSTARRPTSAVRDDAAKVSESTSSERRMSRCPPPRVMGNARGVDDSTLLRLTLLDYQRVSLASQIALKRNETYSATVEEQLKLLEAHALEREKLRAEINRMETELSQQKRANQNVGKHLSSLFAHVLENVTFLRDNMGPVLVEIEKKSERISAGGVLTANEKSKVRFFREALDLLNGGLTMDGPLKQQLEALEMRDAQSVAELEELERRKAKLGKEIEETEKNSNALNTIVKKAEGIHDTIKNASVMVDREKETGRLGDALEKVVEQYHPSSQMVKDLRISVGLHSIHAFVFEEADMGAVEEEEEEEETAAGLQERNNDEKGFNPTSLVERIVKKSSPLEGVVLRCFEYWMTPISFLEQLVLQYCTGPPIEMSDEEVVAFEKTRIAVRLRVLNLLKKWVKMHKHHFLDDFRMATLFKDFMNCAKLTGNEKIAMQIEADYHSMTQPANKPFVVPYLVSAGMKFVPGVLGVCPEEMARQLCLIDHALYKKIEMREFYRCNFMKHEEKAPNIKAFSARFNVFASMVSSSILAEDTAEKRAAIIEWWLMCSMHLRYLHNYFSLLAINGALTGSAINRLKDTWALVEPNLAAHVDVGRELMEKNFSKLRSEMETALHPVVPYLGPYQRDLVYLEESPTWRADALNLSKFKSISQVLINCLQFQSSYYNWFEENTALLKVLEILKDQALSEDELHQKSLVVEPRKEEPPVIEYKTDKPKTKSKASDAVFHDHPPRDEHIVMGRKILRTPISVQRAKHEEMKFEEEEK